MAENIELHSFCISTANETDIEEYHEINPETVRNSTVIPQYSTKTLKDYDFFTQLDTKTTHKGSTKKKKSKKNEKPTNLMDVIASELASMTIPIAENIITIIDQSKEQRNILLESNKLYRKGFRKFIPWCSDLEHGWGKKSSDLSPIFPRVLENAIAEDNTIMVQYVEPTKFNDIIVNYTETELNENTKFLNVELKNMKFNYHHKFSLEKLLCVKLLEVYDEYNNTRRLWENLSREIKVVRETRDNLKRELSRISPKKTADLRFDKTIRKYTAELLQIREKNLEILKKQKEIIHRNISLWADIEMVRERTGETKIPYILDVSKKCLDDDEFEKKWAEVFNTEFTYLLDKIEYEYITNYIEYKESKHDYNMDVSEKNKVVKPRLHIDEDSLKTEAETIVNNIVRRENIELDLRYDESIISHPAKSDKSISNQMFSFKIYIDDIFVCDSEYFSTITGQLFNNIEFIETFSIQILPSNIQMTIVLSENDEEVSNIKVPLIEIRTNSTFAEYTTKIFVYNNKVEPNSKCIGSGHNIKEIATKNKVRLKSSNLFKGNLYSTCEVNIRIGWNEKLNQNQGAAIKTSFEIGRKLKRFMNGSDKPNIDLLKDVIGKIYGRDIEKDEHIIDTLKNICKMDVHVDVNFAIDENSPVFIRLKLLHLRNSGGFANVENKTIPLHASQISTEHLNCLQRSNGNRSNQNEFNVEYYNDKYSEMDPIELQRFIGAKYVQKANDNMLKNLNEYLLKKTHKDVVRDFKDLSLRNLFSNRTNLATLATMSSNTKQQLLNDALAKEQEIQVLVLRAFNLLDRSSTILAEEDEDTSEIAGFKVRPLRPFVRVDYHGASVQTGTAIGCHPSWNQTVKLITKLEPLSSIHINIYDEYKVNISDAYAEEDHSFHSKTVHYRYYNKWLGTIQVPLHTVLCLGTLKGTFKINTPPLLLGYGILQGRESSQSLIPEINQLMKKETAFIYLQITTGLSNLGGQQGYNQPIPSSLEDDYLIKHLNTFVTDYTNNFSSRNISLTFIDTSGRNKCVTQFLQPIPLPDFDCFPKNPKIRFGSALSKSSGFSKSSSSKSSLKRKDVDSSSVIDGEEKESIHSAYEVRSWKNGENQLTKLMNAALRYVSLIPTYEATNSHVVTLLGLELLKVLYGSPLDHTILLASYFLHLGIKCWIAIGLGLPRGISSYVLTKYDHKTHRFVLINEQLSKKSRFMSRNDGFTYYVYEATSGETFELRDVGCPLKTVDYVFDNENIWVNVQSTQDCESMSFDFSRCSDWQQVFDKTIFVMKLSPASETGLYTPTGDMESLRQILEVKLKAKVQKWRSHMKTIWNRYCSSLLREMLPHWEYWAFNPFEPKPLLSQRLKQLMVTYKIFGFPLNMSYVNTKSLVSTVKSTGVHVNDDPNVELGLAVELYAYPNNVISVWVFLVSITRI